MYAIKKNQHFVLVVYVEKRFGSLDKYFLVTISDAFHVRHGVLGLLVDLGEYK